MKASAILLLTAIFAALLFVSRGNAPGGLEARARVRRASGCPIWSDCNNGCKSEGYEGGICAGPFSLQCYCS
uniref:Putative defensin n=1 Tax=Hyalomma excavatum TaxID=257692 RepID=A0A131XRM1_9ACAR